MITNYNDIINKIDRINPIKYAKDRNFINGSVTKLSPYISRGIISTKSVFDFLIEKGYSLKSIQKFVQELVWREFWQMTWIDKNINKDLRTKQKDYIYTGMPKKVNEFNTGINAIDNSIKLLYDTGYMHNHLRMYTASLITNIGKYHWKVPAKWMYYHLLDADWGSNALSWQWVCGSNSNKKYYANQENINRFTNSNQRNTILDKSYDELINYQYEENFEEETNLSLKVNYPKSDIFTNQNEKPICIYNFYNLDTKWRQDIDAHRILLIEPSIFDRYPISDKSMKFILDLSKNIKDIIVFVGEFSDLPIKNSDIYYKEHPLNFNYIGIKDDRDWIFKPENSFSSFFKHWNYVLKNLAY